MLPSLREKINTSQKFLRRRLPSPCMDQKCPVLNLLISLALSLQELRLQKQGWKCPVLFINMNMDTWTKMNIARLTRGSMESCCLLVPSFLVLSPKMLTLKFQIEQLTNHFSLVHAIQLSNMTVNSSLR